MASTLFKAGLVGAVALAGMATNVAGQAQGKLSDKSVTTLMDYAWQILPAKFTTPAGKVVEIDKTKREANSVPVESAREIIRVAYGSAQAQVCELWEEQQANFDTLMRREHDRKKWSEQQMLYITTLHRMTIHAVAGKLRVEEKEGELKVLLEPIKPGEVKCTDEQKAKIRDSIVAYVNLDGAAEKGAAAPVTPTAAPPKKK
jgi:hypothetical protein